MGQPTLDAYALKARVSMRFDRGTYLPCNCFDNCVLGLGLPRSLRRHSRCVCWKSFLFLFDGERAHAWGLCSWVRSTQVLLGNARPVPDARKHPPSDRKSHAQGALRHLHGARQRKASFKRCFLVCLRRCRASPREVYGGCCWWWCALILCFHSNSKLDWRQNQYNCLVLCVAIGILSSPFASPVDKFLCVFICTYSADLVFSQSRISFPRLV